MAAAAADAAEHAPIAHPGRCAVVAWAVAVDKPSTCIACEASLRALLYFGLHMAFWGEGDV